MCESNELTFYLAEYAALRNEIVKRLSFQHQIITITLIAAGTFLSIGYQKNVSSLMILVFPIICLFLAAGWAQNNIRLKQLGDYIRTTIEVKFANNGWENHRFSQFSFKHNNISRHSISVIFGRGIFLATQVVTLSIGVVRIKQLDLSILLILLDIVAIFLTLYLTRRTIIE